MYVTMYVCNSRYTYNTGMCITRYVGNYIYLSVYVERDRLKLDRR